MLKSSQRSVGLAPELLGAPHLSPGLLVGAGVVLMVLSKVRNQSEGELPAAPAALPVMLEVNVQHCSTSCEQLIRDPGQEPLTTWAWGANTDDLRQPPSHKCN